MNFLKNIVVFIFLTGMVFTILQYLPFYEDLLVKTEVSKKTGDNEDGNESDSETDNDGDNENIEFVNDFLNFQLVNFSKTITHSYHSELNYRCSLSTITTPPPEV